MFCVFYVASRLLLFACKSSCPYQLTIINENDDDDDDDDDDDYSALVLLNTVNT